MSETYYPRLAEQAFSCRMENGLTVKIVSRPGFQKKLAYFVTDFGAIHTDFMLEDRHIQAPAGIAHFLEHKMFELPDRDVTAEFAALGANVNAFTSYDMTAYFFSCTEHFEENLRLLLEFVSTAYFTEESIQRELGIIDQEIGMNEDAPDTQVFENLVTQMYDNHPIKVPILGTRESLRQITVQLLNDCHKAFYTPGNMVLCVVADVSSEQVLSVVRDVLGTESKPVGTVIRNWQEQPVCKTEPVVRSMEVAMPTFLMGFKCPPSGKGADAIRTEIIGELACEALFGESSALYLQLYEQGLIDGSFGGGYETVDGCALITCGGDSNDPEAVKQALLRHARKLVAEGIDEQEFLRMKRSALGRRIRDLDSFDSTCFRLCAYHFADFDYFRFPEIYEQITAQDICRFLNEVVQLQRCALSIITPKEV